MERASDDWARRFGSRSVRVFLTISDVFGQFQRGEVCRGLQVDMRLKFLPTRKTASKLLPVLAYIPSFLQRDKLLLQPKFNVVMPPHPLIALQRSPTQRVNIINMRGLWSQIPQHKIMLCGRRALRYEVFGLSGLQ